MYTIGFPNLERILGGGLHAGEIIAIGGRPGSGKTSLATAWALWAAAEMDDGDSCAIFSREVSAEHALRLNMVPQLIGESMRDMSGYDPDRAAMAFEEIVLDTGLTGLPIDIIEGHISTATITDYVARHRPKIIIVDYVQILSGSQADDPRVRVSRAMECISDCVREHNCTAIVLSQFSRPEKQARKKDQEQDELEERPTLERFAESGAVENWSQTCIGIWQKSQTEKTLVVMKQRNGPRDIDVDCLFDGRSKRFYEVTRNPDAIADQVKSRPLF